MIRPLTEHLLECLILDAWPRPAAVVDFGIASPDHLGALQSALKLGRTPEEFDGALGSGRKLTELVRIPGNPYGHVTFETPYDLFASPEGDGEGEVYDWADDFEGGEDADQLID